MKEFSDIRRQQFLYEELYDAALEGIDQSVAAQKKFIAAEADDPFDLGYVVHFDHLFDRALDHLSLEYTAGKPIEEVKALYPAAVAAFEAWVMSFDVWMRHEAPEESCPLIMSNIELDVATSYVQVLRLLSLGVLFNEGVLLRKIAQLLVYKRNKDVIVEELFAPFATNPDRELDYLQHIDLYDDLLGAIWGDNAQASTAAMQKFLKAWYKFYEGASWHNAHLRVGDIEGSPHWANYYGYWAWEAGALAYLYELDDKAYQDNALYPKDLVAWARKQGKPPKSYTPPAGEQSTALSATASTVCTKAGVWFCPNDGQREIRMEVGEKFPATQSGTTGEMIWYWRSV